MGAKAFLLLVAVLGLSLASRIDYEGFKVYKVTPNSERESTILRTLAPLPDFDFWSKYTKLGKPVRVMVAPRSQKLFENILNANKIEFGVQIQNVQNIVEAEREDLNSKDGAIAFDRYFRHSEINRYLDQLAKDYPDIATVETIGQSYEGRDMKLIRISSGSRESHRRPIIFVDAGVHAREWIAPAVALYVINQLVENPENRNLISNVEWIILPSLNPDGYEYSWDVERFWRKTVSPGTKCNGVDVNRNFDFHWQEYASANECAEDYAGQEPYSEIETKNFRNFFNKTDIAAYVTLHSYAECLVYPWGYGFVDVLPENWEELDQLANNMADAISAVSSRGTKYTVGETGPTMYPVGGASDDWAMGVAGVPIVYTLELPGGGDYGFDLPPNEIRGVVEETFEGFRVLGGYIAQNKTFL